MRDGDLVFDEDKEKALANIRAMEEYRKQRESECFSVVNRGQLWYEKLSAKQQEELRQWYKAWLDGTATQTVPKKPSWI